MPNLPITQSEYDGKPKYMRGKSIEYQSFYGAKWRRARLRFLFEHPICAMCESSGIITPANIVDHIKPHKGDRGLFWDRTNWQALCKACHDLKTQKEGVWGK